MSGPQAESAGSAHRSRWRRFSPSMGWRAFWSEIVWTSMRTDPRFKGIQQRAGWSTSVEKEYPR